MKKLTAVIVILIIAGSVAFAQFKSGNIELSGNFTMGSSTEKYSYQGESSSSYDHKYVMFMVIPGYYIVDALSIEPEIGVNAVDKVKPSFFLLLNLSYTMNLLVRNLAIFGRLGYGLSNSFGFPNSFILNRTSSDFDVGVLNLGVGLKSLLGTAAILRAEINYRLFSQSRKSGNMTVDYTHSNIALLLGIGILFQ